MSNGSIGDGAYDINVVPQDVTLSAAASRSPRPRRSRSNNTFYRLFGDGQGNAASPNGSVGSSDYNTVLNLINTRNFQAGYQDWFNDDGQAVHRRHRSEQLDQ